MFVFLFLGRLSSQDKKKRSQQLTSSKGVSSTGTMAKIKAAFDKLVDAVLDGQAATVGILNQSMCVRTSCGHFGLAWVESSRRRIMALLLVLPE